MGAGRHLAVALDLLLATHVAGLGGLAFVQALVSVATAAYPRNSPPLGISLIVSIVEVVLGEDGAGEGGGDGRAVGADVAKDAGRVVHHGRAGRVEAVGVHGGQRCRLSPEKLCRGAGSDGVLCVERTGLVEGSDQGLLKRCLVDQHQDLRVAVAE